MRKISIDSTKAFLNGDKFNRDNTKVSVHNGYAFMYLFGNWIARKNLKNGNININNCGYTTTTTKDRLNAIIYKTRTAHDWDRIFQKDFDWYIIKKVWSVSSTSYSTKQHYPNGWFALVGDDVILDGNEDNPYNEYNPLKGALMVSKFMELMQGEDITQSNKQQKRIFDTVQGLTFPDNWDSLPEVEKTKRLNMIKEIGGEL